MLAYYRPNSVTSFGAESTNLKFVDGRDSCSDSSQSCSDSSQSNTSQQRSYSLSESSDQSESATSTTRLHRPSDSSFRNESFGEHDSLFASSAPSSNEYYNLKIFHRELPEIPRAKSSRLGYSSSRPTAFSSSDVLRHSIEEGSPCYLKKRCLIAVTVISALFSFLSCSIAGMGFVYNTVRKCDSSTFKEGDYETCIPCVQLSDDEGHSSDLKKQLVTKIADDQELCCARTSGQMSALVQLIMTQPKNISVFQAPSQQKFRFSPVSAHKELHPWSSVDTDEPKFEDKRHHLKLSPNNDVNREHVRHVTARNNSLQIQYSGWYFVYSSVYFKPRTDTPCGRLRYQTWGHFINRRSPFRRSTSGTLVQSAHTCCDNCTDDHHTSYAAGVFKLEAGDNIFVEVSGSGLVLFDGNGSYLGLVMLGNLESASNNDTSNGGNHISQK